MFYLNSTTNEASNNKVYEGVVEGIDITPCLALAHVLAHVTVLAHVLSHVSHVHVPVTVLAPIMIAPPGLNISIVIVLLLFLLLLLLLLILSQISPSFSN